ncbi:adenylate/guanylate cyclase domain-containing protein [Bradyrhizobium sp. 24]|uniref:adenylate/guanylate cyclase domain-containing protein n=1 Tax=unclassified Bradyrhizobium TaxID=2631580 RepID=UPI001FF99685|nr:MULTISPECIES: adenylate/guanylate cyclase domain-containing protein [unclassified Bradyrhizobium]MCK1299618.1 adenylate/guanylate cyclase domain-containing protein [Bradyrhizobium sp. 37]MCK1379601.1 adenylate/guanylate cyclase domain-containing protein [Bradyrhizobium sp. 24]MCK1769396.1 adenylate/guanylate cyclase domain-containing protein [Bradyrhizobium sp. 134]
MAIERPNRRLTTILAADAVGYSRLVRTDEEGTLDRLRVIRKDMIDPVIAAHRGRIVKTTGDGLLAEFASVVDAVRSAIDVQRAMAESNAGQGPDKRIEFRIGINLGDVVVEDDGDLMGDGVNVAARLEGIAEPGGICLSSSAYDQVRGKIDIAAQDRGQQQLKNIAEPVQVYALSPTRPPAMAPHTAIAPRLSIVVLPFVNLDGNSEQDYFVDGVTESLTTDLSRIPGAFVIARNTAFTFKSKPVDVRVVGRELGVRYVMEGSVQGGGDRVRVNAQLIDTETGAHLWAERFDKPRADIFDMQDEITTRLARTVGIELVAAEGRRAERERPNNMDAVDLAMRGWAILNQPLSLRRDRAACDLFQEALRLDARNVEALVGLAFYHGNELRTFASTNRDEQLRTAHAAITEALTLAPGNALAHFVHANVLHVSGATERALRELEFAITLDRNLAWAYADAGFMKVLLGRAEEAEADLTNAIRLSPRDPGLDRWHALLGIADLFLGRLDSALNRLQRSVGINPHVAMPHFFLAAASALSGGATEALEARNAGLRLDPNFTVARFRNERRSENPTFLAQRERIYEGLRLAGVPEG